MLDIFTYNTWIIWKVRTQISQGIFVVPLEIVNHALKKFKSWSYVRKQLALGVVELMQA